MLAKTAGAEGLEASRGSGDQMPAGAVCPRQPCRSVQGGKRPAGRDGRRELDTTAPGPSLPWPSSSRPLAAAAARACCPPGSCAAGPGLPSVATTATARYQPRLLPLSAGMGRGAGGPGCGGCGRAAAHAPSGQRPSPPRPLFSLRERGPAAYRSRRSVPYGDMAAAPRQPRPRKRLPNPARCEPTPPTVIRTTRWRPPLAELCAKPEGGAATVKRRPFPDTPLSQTGEWLWRGTGGGGGHEPGIVARGGRRRRRR